MYHISLVTAYTMPKTLSRLSELSLANHGPCGTLRILVKLDCFKAFRTDP